jgi:hypothetical protein
MLMENDSRFVQVMVDFMYPYRSLPDRRQVRRTESEKVRKFAVRMSNQDRLGYG